MVKSDSKAERAHLLLVVVKNDEVSINAVVFSDKVQERHSDIAKSDEVLPFHLIFQIVDADSIIQSGMRLVDIVPDLENSSFIL